MWLRSPVLLKPPHGPAIRWQTNGRLIAPHHDWLGFLPESAVEFDAIYESDGRLFITMVDRNGEIWLGEGSGERGMWRKVLSRDEIGGLLLPNTLALCRVRGDVMIVGAFARGQRWYLWEASASGDRQLLRKPPIGLPAPRELRICGDEAVFLGLHRRGWFLGRWRLQPPFQARWRRLGGHKYRCHSLSATAQSAVWLEGKEDEVHFVGRAEVGGDGDVGRDGSMVAFVPEVSLEGRGKGIAGGPYRIDVGGGNGIWLGTRQDTGWVIIFSRDVDVEAPFTVRSERSAPSDRQHQDQQPTFWAPEIEYVRVAGMGGNCFLAQPAADGNWHLLTRPP